MSKIQAALDYAIKNFREQDNSEAILAPYLEDMYRMVDEGAYSGSQIGQATSFAAYADHVTAELQAENAALRAKIANLEQTILDMQESAGDDLK